MLSLDEKLVALLQEGPLTVAELRARYRQRWVVAPPLETVRRALTSERFRRLTGDQFTLPELVEAEVGPPPASPTVTLASLPELLKPDASFVVVDVETTGVDAEDRVFQIAGVRFECGRPAAVFNFYLSPAPRELSLALRRALGIAGNPELERLVAEAPEPEQVLPHVRELIDGLPWVAHNARFDREHLERLGFRTPVAFDTLELAGLLLPTLSSLQESEVAEALGIDAASAAAHPLLAPLLSRMVGPRVYGSYHNALTDVLVLSNILISLLDRLPEHIRAAWNRLGRNEPPLDEAVVEALLRGGGTPACSVAAETTETLNGIDPIEALHHYLDHLGKQPRDEQNQMVRLVSDAFASGESCAIEAPTGTGKTLAYLFPALAEASRRGQKACLCTATKNLQDQLAEELERLEAWGALPVRSAVIKGSGNYLCLAHLRRRLREVLHAGSGVRPDELYAALFWLSFAQASADGLLEQVPLALLRRFPTLEAWRMELKATTACDSRDGTGPHRRCWRAAVYARAARADVVVMNHALWLSNRGGIDGAGIVVADEAHELEDAATSYLQKEVSGFSLQSTLRRLFDPASGSGLLVILAGVVGQEGTGALLARARSAQARELPALGAAFREFLRRIRVAEDPRYGARLQITPFPERTLSYRWRDVRLAWRDLCDLQVRPLLEQLARTVDDPRLDGGLQRALTGIVESLAEQMETASDILNPRNRRFVHLLDLDAERGDPTDVLRWTLQATPIDVSAALRDAYSDLPTTFTSATLDTGLGEGGPGGMHYSLDRIGLGFVPAHRRHILPPVLPYGSQAGLAIARAMVHAPLAHTSRSFVGELTEAYERLLTLSRGRALLLFTARTRMAAVVSPLREGLTEIEVLCQGEDRPHRLLRRFREDVHSVLAGLKQFWQGVDVPGEALSLVFMEKLPFPLYGDPLIRARAALVERRGGNPFQDYLLPGMLIAFKQGFGRLMRGPDDRGAVVIFDRRVATKAYLRRLEGCLPGFLPRDPQGERTWSGLVSYLQRALPDVLSPEAAGIDFPDRLEGDTFRCPELPLPLQDPAAHGTGIEAALRAFGHEAFRTPAQQAVTEAQLAHEDVLGLLPTGAGKSLTFQLPALAGAGLTLVVSPLISLMRDQVEHLYARGFEEVAALYSGQSGDERRDTLDRLRLGRLKLLYLAPERLRDPVLLEALRRTRVRALVVDEAHCLYAWGPHFRPEFLYIPELFQHIGRVPIAALTATAPPPRRAEILRALGMELGSTRVVVSSFARPELRFVVFGPDSLHNRITGPQAKLRTLLKILTAARRDGDAAIIYVNTTAGADLLASQLQLAGFDARSYHGRMTTAERHDVQDLFMEDHIRTVVCTKAFGMGVDKPGVRYVIHYDVPGDLVAYAQEAGRAGRSLPAEEEAWCVLLYYPADRWIHMRFAEGRLPDEALMATVADDLREQWDGQGPILYNVQEALERLTPPSDDPLDETAVNVAIHRLAELGFLRRGVDVVTQCLMWQDEGVSAGAIQEPRLTRVFGQVPTERPEGPSTPIELSTVAGTLGLTFPEVSQALTELAVDGIIHLTPIRRAAALEVLPPLRDGERPIFPSEAKHRMYQEALTGWDEMQRYAEATSGCRTAALLRHLGEPGEPEPCGTCDLCAPRRERPWGGITDDEVPRPIDHIEVAGLLLETVWWNRQRPIDGEGLPLGEGTLWATLTGNDYYLSRHGGKERVRRCPFYGLFRSFPGKEQGLRRFFDHLVQLGYCKRSEASFQQGDAPVVYQYPDLTAEGQEVLRSGAYIDLNPTGERE